jgi:hypothetical protein
MPVHSARSGWFVTSVQQDASKTSLQASLSSCASFTTREAGFKTTEHGEIKKDLCITPLGKTQIKIACLKKFRAI